MPRTYRKKATILPVDVSSDEAELDFSLDGESPLPLPNVNPNSLNKINEETPEFKARLNQYLTDFDFGGDGKVLSSDMGLLKNLITLEFQISALNKRLSQAISSDMDIREITELQKAITGLSAVYTSNMRDLKITPKERKGDNKESLATLIPTLKKQAREYLDKVRKKITCPNCNLTLAYYWQQNEEADFVLQVTCHQCLNVLRLTSKEPQP